MPNPVRTTTFEWNISGCHAAPTRGAIPHCRPVSVVGLTPTVGLLLLPAITSPLVTGILPGVSLGLGV